MTQKAKTPAPSEGMSRGMTLLFAIASGASVGNLYWAQPLLAPIADTFGTARGDAGLVITLTQIGYAIGVFLIVPLGDTMNRKRVVPAVMLLCSAALAAISLAPSFPGLLAATGLLGVFTIAGQILMPLAGDLATDDQRGRVLGTVASGLMLGILVVRAASGVLADVLGWRAVFLVAAAIMLILGLVAARRLPSLEPKHSMPYGRLLWSVLATLKGDRNVKLTILQGVLPMSVFTLFWTGLTLLLSSEPFGYSTSQIGLIGMMAIVGAAAAQGAGRLYDRGLSSQGLVGGIAIALAALIIAGFGQGALAAILVAILLFSVGLQAVLVLAQTRMLAINPAARSRLNTIYVVCLFVGGAIGSSIAGMLWSWTGWSGLMTVGSVILLLALAVSAYQHRKTSAQVGQVR